MMVTNSFNREKPIFTFLVLILLLFSVCRAEKKEHFQDSILFFSGNMFSYLNNLEYFNKYRSGEPFWGVYVQTRLQYRPLPRLFFSIGVHVRKDYGDDQFFSDARPLFQAQYVNKNFSFTMGELINDNRHGLLDAILSEQFAYRSVVEEGIQIQYDGSCISQDLWTNYPAINTPEHREHLCVGNVTTAKFGNVKMLFMGYISHYGGQIYHPLGEVVGENLTGAAGVTYGHEFQKIFQEVGIEQYFIGSYTAIDRSLAYSKGWGSISRLWLKAFNFTFLLQFFKGEHYVTWEGNPMYQTDQPYSFFEISRMVSFSKDVFFDFGLRFDFMDVPPPHAFQDNQIWFLLGCNLNKKIR